MIAKPPPHRLSGIAGLPQILLVVGLVLGVMILIDFNRRLTNAQRLVNDATELARDVATLQAQRDILSTEKAYANSDQAVEDWARSGGKELQPGEVLVIPVPADGVTPTPQTPVATPPIAISNQDLWWELFFDSKLIP